MLARRFPQADVASKLERLPNGASQALHPLSPERYRLQLTLSRQVKEKLELARDLTSHTNSSGDLAVVIERALDLLIAQKQQRRFGKTMQAGQGQRRKSQRHSGAAVPLDGAVSSEPTPLSPSAIANAFRDTAHRAHISNDVRRQVVERDTEQCAFVSDQGCRCEARAFLQFHHRRPWAIGGADTADNFQLLCHEHNRLFAERDFGRASQRRRPKRLG